MSYYLKAKDPVLPPSRLRRTTVDFLSGLLYGHLKVWKRLGYSRSGQTAFVVARGPDSAGRAPHPATVRACLTHKWATYGPGGRIVLTRTGMAALDRYIVRD